jgi:transcriptional regulator with GAF, ATPase, and Fis domain
VPGTRPRIIGNSPVLEQVLKIVDKVAPTETTVLVTGESGTGKELIVRQLHNNSLRRDKPLVPINCGAIPADLLESELFGHEKGAFTHAVRSRAGRFELANGGTVFLDEIGELDPLLQVKILRAIQEKEIERVGASQTLKVDVRIVAATNRNLESEVAAGRFREDLYYRLNVVPVQIPPLRQRKEDIIELATHFLNHFCHRKKREPLSIDSRARELLLRYSWPGNVRELENFMERMSILCDSQTVTPEDLPEKILGECREAAQEAPGTAAQPAAFSWPQLKDIQDLDLNLKDFLDAVEVSLLNEALEQSQGIKNKAAEILGIKRTTLIEKLKKKNM